MSAELESSYTSSLVRLCQLLFSASDAIIEEGLTLFQSNKCIEVLVLDKSLADFELEL